MSKALSLLLTVLLCTAVHGQQLTPRLLVVEGDSLHAFTQAQAVTLAKLLTRKMFLQKAVALHQQIQAEQAQQIGESKQIIELQARELGIREQQLQGCHQVTAAQGKALTQQQAQITELEQEVTRQRRRRRVAAVLQTAGTIILLILL